MKRIDAHQHFWRLTRGDYAWLTGALAPIYRDFLPSDLAPLLAGIGVDKTVLVQAAPTIDETRFLLSLAEQAPFVAGVVGWVDMAGEQGMAQLAEISQHPKLLGIRPVIQDIVDVDWMLQPVLEPLFRELIAKNLTFDALVKQKHLANLAVIANRYPTLKIVIDHAAKPDIKKNGYGEWSASIAALAAFPNVYCKLSGLLTEAPPNADKQCLEPYVEHLFAHFGCARLLWGSDWPVLNLASDYNRWYELALALCSKLSPAEKSAVFGGNAISFYGL